MLHSSVYHSFLKCLLSVWSEGPFCCFCFVFINFGVPTKQKYRLQKALFTCFKAKIYRRKTTVHRPNDRSIRIMHVMHVRLSILWRQASEVQNVKRLQESRPSTFHAFRLMKETKRCTITKPIRAGGFPENIMENAN